MTAGALILQTKNGVIVDERYQQNRAKSTLGTVIEPADRRVEPRLTAMPNPKELREAYEKVAIFPEARWNGFFDLLALRNMVPAAADEIERLRAALQKIIDAAGSDSLEALDDAEAIARKALMDG